MPVSVELAAVIPAPPEALWTLLTDWERQGEWMLEASDFVVTSPHRTGIGVEAEATIRVAGITTRDRVRVVGWEPCHRLAILHLGWVTGTGEFFLTPAGMERTHLFWREELSAPFGVPGALGLRLFKPLLKRTFARDLEVLTRLAGATRSAQA